MIFPKKLSNFSIEEKFIFFHHIRENYCQSKREDQNSWSRFSQNRTKERSRSTESSTNFHCIKEYMIPIGKKFIYLRDTDKNDCRSKSEDQNRLHVSREIGRKNEVKASSSTNFRCIKEYTIPIGKKFIFFVISARIIVNRRVNSETSGHVSREIERKNEVDASSSTNLHCSREYTIPRRKKNLFS